MSSAAIRKALEVGLVRLSTDSIRKSRVNGKIYAPRTRDDIRRLAMSIKRNGLLEPILVTLDGFIISGHSRHRACRCLGMAEVDCRVLDVWSTDPAFPKLIVECNRQRAKTIDEIVRECLTLRVDGEDALASLMSRRKALAERSTVDVQTIKIRGRQSRKKISAAKRPMLRAVLEIIKEHEPYWPMSDRQIHYRLLNDPPLRHASKPEIYFNKKGEQCFNRYRNDAKSYKDLTDLLTRARVSGDIEVRAIADPTRTSEGWEHLYKAVGPYISNELDTFLGLYHRDYQQSQPCHIEIVGEKNTVAGVIQPIAKEFDIPYTIARGYSSYEPRHKIRERFWESGKDRLVVLVLSDFDPEGEDIPNSLGKSLRDDLGIDSMDIIKVGLTQQQAIDRGLVSLTLPKKKSSRYKAFVRKYGVDCPVFELEALSSADLSQILRDAVLNVLDVDAYNREGDRHKEELAKLESLRIAVKPVLLEIVNRQKPE